MANYEARPLGPGKQGLRICYTYTCTCMQVNISFKLQLLTKHLLFPTFYEFSAIFHRMSLLLGFLGFFFIVLICFWLTKFLPCKYFLIFKKFWGALMDLKNKIRLHTVDIFTCTSMHIIKSLVNFHDLGPFVRSLKNTRFKPSNFVLSSWH